MEVDLLFLIVSATQMPQAKARATQWALERGAMVCERGLKPDADPSSSSNFAAIHNNTNSPGSRQANNRNQTCYPFLTTPCCCLRPLTVRSITYLSFFLVAHPSSPSHLARYSRIYSSLSTCLLPLLACPANPVLPSPQNLLREPPLVCQTLPGQLDCIISSPRQQQPTLFAFFSIYPSHHTSQSCAHQQRSSSASRLSPSLRSRSRSSTRSRAGGRTQPRLSHQLCLLHRHHH